MKIVSSKMLTKKYGEMGIEKLIPNGTVTLTDSKGFLYLYSVYLMKDKKGVILVIDLSIGEHGMERTPSFTLFEYHELIFDCKINVNTTEFLKICEKYLERVLCTKKL